MLRALFPRAVAALVLGVSLLGCSVFDHSDSSTEHAANTRQALGPGGTGGDAGATDGNSGNGGIAGGGGSAPSDAGAADAGAPGCTQDADCGNGCGVCTSGVCSVAGSGVVCRAAVDAICDLAETCDGTSKDCPTDGYAATSVVCKPQAGDCDVEDKCDGAGKCASDAVQPSSHVCRAALDPLCDIAEKCDGSTKVCPGDVTQPATVVCHDKTGECDIVDKCDGNGLCTGDAVEVSGHVCRVKVDAICDIEEVCDGTSKACPNDTWQPNTVACRGSAGDCDAPESCTGTDGKCALDIKLNASTTCRSSKGACDKAEVCDGVSNNCPTVDVKFGPSQTCNPVKPGDLCDVAEVCNGTSDFCPTDAFRTSDTVCRPAVAGDCDVAEKCTGSGPACPHDDFQLSTHICRPASADPTSCDVPEFCNGSNSICPPDGVADNTHVCRPLIPQQPCDQVETCDGVTKACPVNSFKPAGAGCSDGFDCTEADKCDAAGHCSGTANNNLCPADICETPLCVVDKGCQNSAVAKGTLCRKAKGVCDVDEVCNGTNLSCPSDVLLASTVQCQPLSCKDSNLKPKITCDGANPACPITPDVSCGNFACGSTTECRTTCVTSADCGTAFYCLNNDCIPRIGAGQMCKSDAQCSVSNPHCVDGVCCDTTCTGQCEACNVADKVGTCVGVKGDPIAPRMLCAADGTSCDGFCDPSNRTACQFPNKATSCRDAACDTKTNAAVAESFCTGKGSCARTDSVACEPYACNGAACAGNCTADAQCATDAYCQAGKCTPKGKPAEKCTTDKQCGSGHCADGVCCDTACTGQCEACSGVAGAKAGTCSAVSGDPLGKKPACAAADAACAGSCDGKNRLSCIYPAQGKVCRPGACAEGEATVTASCDGHGACPAALTITCEKGCEGKVCAGDECVSDKDCGDAAKYCAAGVCTPKGAPGSACSSAAACQTGFCTDGVCCDSACLGQCESCDASGSMGTCSAVPKGDSPHGGRTGCATDGSVCGGACDGSTRDNCKYPFDVTCRAGSCAPGATPDDPATSVLEASCVGNGSCPAEQQQLCGADGCDVKGKLCDGACAADKNACKASEYCSAGECLARLPVATACANDAQCGSGFCVDGVCCNKRCGDQCAACDVPGSVGTCAAVVGGTHGGRGACGGVGTCGAACDGTVIASCSFAANDVSCGEPFCSAGLHGEAPECDGAGVCAPAVTSECKSYICDGADCSSQCVHNTDCVKALECRDGQCVPPRYIDAVDKGSCGCAVPGSTSRTPASVFYLLGLCAAAAFRRRRQAA